MDGRDPPGQLFGGGGLINHLPKLLPLCPTSFCTNSTPYPGRKTLFLGLGSLSSVTLEMGSQKNSRINLNNVKPPPGTGQPL